MSEQKKVTETPELSDMTVEEILSGDSKVRAKHAIADMKSAFINLAFENEQLVLKKKRIEQELKKQPTIIAFNDLKKEIRKNKKLLEQYAAIYQGGLQLADKLGIKIDVTVMKRLQEGK